MSDDLVNRPGHYTEVVPGIEMSDVAEHFGFCLGNVIKYVWRAGRKHDALEDLRKARWYLDREVARLEQERAQMRAELEQDLNPPTVTITVTEHPGMGKLFQFPPPAERWHE